MNQSIKQQLKTIATYPFLNTSKAYVKNNDYSIDELLHDPLYDPARERGIKRIYNAFEEADVGDHATATESEQIMELLSYPVARMIAVCINDPHFLKRYALAEATHIYKKLKHEPIDMILEVAKEFKMIYTYDQNTETIQIYFTDYLAHAPTIDEKWKLVNKELSEGYVTVTRTILCRLLQEAIRHRIIEEMEKQKCNAQIYKTFAAEINRIKNKVNEYRKEIEAMPVGELDVEKLPPCISILLAEIQAGENVPHAGRFALVSFLHSIRMGTEEILQLFSRAPDYEEDKTRYQVEHITGDSSATSYKAPGCGKLRTYGLCPTDKMDGLCKRIKHPVLYYKKKWKKKK